MTTETRSWLGTTTGVAQSSTLSRRRRAGARCARSCPWPARCRATPRRRGRRRWPGRSPGRGRCRPGGASGTGRPGRSARRPGRRPRAPCPGRGRRPRARRGRRRVPTRTLDRRAGGVCTRALPTRLATTWRSRSSSPSDDERAVGARRVIGAVGSTARGVAHGVVDERGEVDRRAARAGGPGRAGPAAAGRRRARPCAPPPARCGAWPRRARRASPRPPARYSSA